MSTYEAQAWLDERFAEQWSQYRLRSWSVAVFPRLMIEVMQPHPDFACEGLCR